MTMSDNTHYSTLFHKPSGDYFLTHSIGLVPYSTQDALIENYLTPWQHASSHTWPTWLNAIEDFKQQLATLFNSSSDLFCPQANVTAAISKLIPALGAHSKLAKRRIIIATESDFPSTRFAFQQAEKLGFTLKILPEPVDLQSLEIWDDALNEDVHCAFITQVVYNTNARLPVEEIAKLCQMLGIISVVDVAQAAGIVPINLAKLGADIVVGSCIKWLCGGPGAGFIWIRKALIPLLEPTDVGWFSHQNPFEYDSNNFEYHESANRFWGGTPSIAPYIAASNSIGLINQIGMDTIQRHNQNLTKRLMSAIPDQYLNSPSALEQKGGTTVFDFSRINKSYQAEIEHRMTLNGIHFDSRQYGVRLSPHIYNTESEIDRLIECFEV